MKFVKLFGDLYLNTEYIAFITWDNSTDENGTWFAIWITDINNDDYLWGSYKTEGERDEMLAELLASLKE